MVANGEQGGVDRLDEVAADQSGSKMVATSGGEPSKLWSWREESNLQPVVYKTTALPIELRQRQWQRVHDRNFPCKYMVRCLDLLRLFGYSRRARSL